MTPEPRPFTRWTVTNAPAGPVTADRRDLEQWISYRELAPGARGMSDADICHQYNNVNAGEVWMTAPDDPPPVVVRRTRANPDDTEPTLWAFFVADEAAARVWIDAGQADELEHLEPGQ